MSANLRHRNPHDGASLSYNPGSRPRPHLGLDSGLNMGSSDLSRINNSLKDLFNRVDAQDQKIAQLEEYKKKSKLAIVKLHRELSQQQRVVNFIETAVLPYLKKMTEEAMKTEDAQHVSARGLNQRTLDCMQPQSTSQLKDAKKSFMQSLKEDEDNSFLLKLFVVVLAILMAYAGAIISIKNIETWFNKVAYPLLDLGYNVTKGFVENSVAALFSNESDCMLCGTKDAVYSFAARAYSGAANVSAAIMAGAGV